MLSGEFHVSSCKPSFVKHILLDFANLTPVLLFYCSSSEPDVEATLDKMFDELAFKQNDSKYIFSSSENL